MFYQCYVCAVAKQRNVQYKSFGHHGHHVALVEKGKIHGEARTRAILEEYAPGTPSYFFFFADGVGEAAVDPEYFESGCN